MKKINFFLPITPYTLSIAENLIERELPSKEVENILVNPHNLNYKKDLWSVVYNDDVTREVNDNKTLRYINFFKQVLVFSRLYKRIKKYQDVPLNFYYVDLAHVLSNAIFFSFNKIQHRYVVEDGLLNYYKQTLKGKMLNKNMSNYFLRLFGLKTNKFEGHITGVEMEKVNNQYVFFPKLAFGSEKSLQIPYEKFSYKLNNKILIIGQEPIINFISVKQYLYCLNEIIDDFLNKSDNCEFHYKPHHHGVKDLAKNFLQEKLNGEFFYIEDKTPIHNLIDQIKPSKVASFGSTASLNLKLILPNKVESYVYLLRAKELKINNNLEILFHKVNINIKELKCNL